MLSAMSQIVYGSGLHYYCKCAKSYPLVYTITATMLMIVLHGYFYVFMPSSFLQPKYRDKTILLISKEKKN